MNVISIRKKSPAAKSKLAAPVIDFPAAGEKISPGHYAIRISSPAGHVDVSIDAGPWHRCRHSVGYHWFDWVCHARGTYQIVARIVSADGGEVKSKPRSCRVA